MTTLVANPVEAPAHVHQLLEELHALSKEQDKHKDRELFLRIGKDAYFRDKFVALDQDKSQFIYSYIRASNAKNVVEAGTSFGVSTIYLALALAANAKDNGGSPRVIATENEPTKIAKAKEYWKQAGTEVEAVIDLREGDILETLKTKMPEVDVLLLDIWTPIVLPIFKLVLPHLRKGAVIFADNTLDSATGYKDFLDTVRAPGSGFINLTLPYTGGLDMCVYTGRSE